MGNVIGRILWISCFSTAWVGSGCGSEEGTAEESDTGTDTGTDTGETAGDGGAGTDSVAQLCPDFAAKLMACGASEDSLPEVQEICGKFESVFNEGFIQGLYTCLEQLDCEELLALLEAPDAGAPGGADAGVPAMPEEPSVIETCMMTALLTAEPGPANDAFQQHYCDWLVSCDTSMGPNECRASFTNSEFMFFSVMADPFVLQADACVNPPPPCENAQAVDICLNGVVESFTQAFGI